MIMNRTNKILLYIALLIASCLILFPLLYTLSSSFMTNSESATYPPRIVPSHLNWENYIHVIQTIPVIRFIGNSFIVSTFIMLGQIITASTAAYAFAFLRFPGKTFLFALFLATMMIPWEVIMIPNYMTIKSWNLLDSYTGLILPFVASAFGTFLLRQSFLQLPRELFEAARIDGCGHIRIFLSLVLPLSTPAIATLGVYSFLNRICTYGHYLLRTKRKCGRFRSGSACYSLKS